MQKKKHGWLVRQWCTHGEWRMAGWNSWHPNYPTYNIDCGLSPAAHKEYISRCKLLNTKKQPKWLRCGCQGNAAVWHVKTKCMPDLELMGPLSWEAVLCRSLAFTSLPVSSLACLHLFSETSLTWGMGRWHRAGSVSWLGRDRVHTPHKCSRIWKKGTNSPAVFNISRDNLACCCHKSDPCLYKWTIHNPHLQIHLILWGI